jgi:hypothetical protein
VEEIVINAIMFNVHTMTMAMTFLIEIFQNPEMTLPYFHLVFQFGCDVAQDTDPVRMPVGVGINMVIILMVQIQET